MLFRSVRHQWLFARHWVEESWDEIQDNELDFHKREEKINKLREDAIAEVWKAAGIAGILRLCQAGEAADLVGHYLAGLAPADLDPVEFIARLIAETSSGSLAPFNMCLLGYLFRLDDASREKLLTILIKRFKLEGRTGEGSIIRLLKYAPCKKSTWQIADHLPVELQARYWTEASLNCASNDEQELRELVERLLLIKQIGRASCRERV